MMEIVTLFFMEWWQGGRPRYSLWLQHTCKLWEQLYSRNSVGSVDAEMNAKDQRGHRCVPIRPVAERTAM